MSKPPRPDLRSIVAASARPPASARPQEQVVPFRAAPPAEEPPRKTGRTLKERAKQLSVYLEPPVHDQLRDLAYTERTKIHALMLEGLDLLFRDRGARSIADLEGQQRDREAGQGSERVPRL